MNNCTSFQKEIEKFKEKTRFLSERLLEFKESGKKEIIEKIKEEITVMEREIEEFRDKEYAPKVLEMLSVWYPKDDRDAFLKTIEFEKNGRVFVNGDVDVRNSHISYVSGLIRRIGGDGDFRGTSIEGLDELEEADWSLHCDDVKDFKSAKKLRRIGNKGNFSGTSIEELDELEEIEGTLDFSETKIFNVQEFRKVFPRLKKIEEDADGNSIILSSNQRKLAKELKELRQKGELEFEGKIKIV